MTARGLPSRPRYGEETLCANRFDAIVRVAMGERVENLNYSTVTSSTRKATEAISLTI